MKRGLFSKYVILLVGLVGGVLVINAALDLWFAYQDNRRASIEVQREKARAAAQRVEDFTREIERQIGWVAHPQWVLLPEEQRRFDYVRLQRQVPAITELAYLDNQGRELLKVSRLSMDMVGSGLDRSTDPAYVGAVSRSPYFGQVYFHRDSEPFITMAVRHGSRGGVTVADVNLKLILRVIEDLKFGTSGYAYVVDALGRLVAHPDISLVLRGTSMNSLPQVTAVREPNAPPVHDTVNLAGVPVLSAFATIESLQWFVFVEIPRAEAEKPVILAAYRALALLALGLLIAALAAALLARRMVVPIRALQIGAQRVGDGDLGHRIDIKTGDELEALANQFNRSSRALQESHENLEQRVMDRTQELSESLEQQTATAGVLQVISQSPTDAQPVFDAIAESALRLLNGWSIIVWQYDGQKMRATSIRGGLPGSAETLRATIDSIPMEDLPLVANVVRTGEVQQIVDAETDEVSPQVRELARLRGWRSNIAVPMKSEGEIIGMFSLTRIEPGTFAGREIQLLKTFADQAVIAIQNVKVFTELREALDQQTATSEILRVISRSPTDVQPVLDVIAESAVKLCEGQYCTVFRYDGGQMHFAALNHSTSWPEFMDQIIARYPRPPSRRTLVGLALLDRAVVSSDDVTTDPRLTIGPQYIQGTYRTAMAVPMLQDGEAIGAILVSREEVRPFTDKQLELVKTFADQAVIAIQNVKVFTELRETLEQQTATAEILRVISSSPTDVQPVLDAVVQAAVRLCGAQDALIAMRDGDEFVFAAHRGPLGGTPGTRAEISRSSVLGRAMLTARTVHVPDVSTLDPVEFAGTVEGARQFGYRALVGAPMNRDGNAVGVLMLRKPEPGPFTDRQIELLETFAAQAVIAIQNVRLFTEIQEKSRQLEVASQHKSQFLANMSHELRTPLNAILGYTEMMVDGLYGNLPEKATSTLERVQANGKHLLGLINDVLDLSKIEAGQLTLAVEDFSVADMVSTVLSATESLARTKKIALEAAIPPGLPRGTADSRRLAQVLLNLVGNAIKFTDEGKVEIRAARVNDNFEISVVDTGPGIAQEDQAKIFEEFQQVDNTSTRKKGGTGLGLSISRKIVELHGGRITVESEVGKGSTFKVTIPVNAASAKEAAQ